MKMRRSRAGALAIVAALLAGTGASATSTAPADEALRHIEVTADNVNIRTAPDTGAPVVARTDAGDVFVLEGTEGDWYAIRMFNGMPRYIHSSLAEPTVFRGRLPADPEERRRIFRALWQAGGAATAAADREIPMWRSVDRHMDYEALMDDRLALRVLQRNNVQPPLLEALREEGLARYWWW